jgi:hypothetical protein
LDVLACGDVGRAFVAASVHCIGQDVQLIGLDHAVGQAKPHHETARRDGAEEDPQPFEADREISLIEVLPTLRSQFGQPRSQIQTAAFGLGLLNLAETFRFRLNGGPGCCDIRGG